MQYSIFLSFVEVEILGHFTPFTVVIHRNAVRRASFENTNPFTWTEINTKRDSIFIVILIITVQKSFAQKMHAKRHCDTLVINYCRLPCPYFVVTIVLAYTSARASC